MKEPRLSSLALVLLGLIAAQHAACSPGPKNEVSPEFAKKLSDEKSKKARLAIVVGNYERVNRRVAELGHPGFELQNLPLLATKHARRLAEASAAAWNLEASQREALGSTSADPPTTRPSSLKPITEEDLAKDRQEREKLKSMMELLSAEDKTRLDRGIPVLWYSVPPFISLRKKEVAEAQAAATELAKPLFSVLSGSLAEHIKLLLYARIIHNAHLRLDELKPSALHTEWDELLDRWGDDRDREYFLHPLELGAHDMNNNSRQLRVAFERCFVEAKAWK